MTGLLAPISSIAPLNPAFPVKIQRSITGLELSFWIPPAPPHEVLLRKAQSRITGALLPFTMACLFPSKAQLEKTGGLLASETAGRWPFRKAQLVMKPPAS